MKKAIIILLLLTSCFKKESSALPVNHYPDSDTLSVLYYDNKTAKEINYTNQEPDTTGERTINELTFLKNKNLLPANFDNDKVVFYKNYKLDNLDYNLLKIEYSSEMGEKYLQDPYVNLIYVKSGNELVKHIVLYSIDEEDVGYAFTSDNNIFFKQYDSSTGWKKYISFLISSSGFIETDQLDETEEIVQSSINLTELTYQTKLSKKARKFRVVD